jgi:ferredoxin-NADP reductase
MSLACFSLRVVSVTQETPDVHTFRFEVPPDFPMDWKPGQFITVNFPDDPKTKRAYSLSSSPLDGNYLEVTVKLMGNFGTRFYNEAHAGTVLNVIPPRGKFVLPDDSTTPLLLMAGGSGVTPYRSMMRYIAQKKFPTRVTVLYSVRVPDDIIFKKEFEQLCAANSNFRFVVTCTRVAPEDPSWTGLRGRINADMIRQHDPDPQRTHYYSCGAREFVRSMAQTLAEMNIPRDRIIYEDWG